MANLIVVGTQWGDEGKGKLVDILSQWFDAVARYQGGNNAGHTVVVGEEKIVLHLVPSGVLRRGKICVLGNGVVIDLEALIHEMDQLERLQVRLEGNLYVSKGAHLVLPYHKILDAVREAKAHNRIGTTGRGIGPAYVDKMARVGIRVAALEDPAVFRDRVVHNLAEKRAQHPDNEALGALDADKICADHMEFAKRIAPFEADTSLVLDRMLKEGKRVLFEGAQGTLLDIDLGTYPYVTSSSATAGGACTGTGVSPRRIDGILGVVKAYTTRVGGGPFPTELTDAVGEYLRERGQEFGATTGRPRRCGWFDAVGVRYAVRVNGVDALALTKLDVLDQVDPIRICVGYRWRGQRVDEFPVETVHLLACEPIYEDLPGWKAPTVGILKYGDLPGNCRRYIERLEAVAGAPCALISTGPRRSETILRDLPILAQWRLGPVG